MPDLATVATPDLVMVNEWRRRPEVSNRRFASEEYSGREREDPGTGK